MQKLILISALLFSFNGWAEDYACGVLSTDYVGENLEEVILSNQEVNYLGATIAVAHVIVEYVF